MGYANGQFFGSFTASALRCGLTTIGLLIIAIVHKELQKIEWRRDYKWFLVMVVSSIFISGPLYYAILQAGVGISIGLNYIGIVIGMFVFGWLFMGERYTRDKLTSTILGIIGILLVFSPSLKLAGWLALTGVLLSGFASGANMSATKKIPYSGSQSAVIGWVFGFIVNTPIAFLLHESMPIIGWRVQWLYLLAFAVTGMIASWTFVQGLKLIEAGAAGILGLLEVVFGVGFGVVIFHERPSTIVLLGIISIIAAAAIPYLQHYNAQKGILEESKS